MRRLTTGLRYNLLLCLIFPLLCVAVRQQRWNIWPSDPVRQIILGQHLPGGRNQAGIIVRIVLGHLRPRAQQRQTVSVRLGKEERRSSLALAILQGVRQRLPFALRQEHDAEHGKDCEGGEDDVVQEVAAVILELHEGRGGHANAACCQHQTETAASDTWMKKIKQHGAQIK